jgi:hypothetical protein
MIVEAGVHELYDGTIIQANRTVSLEKSTKQDANKVQFM